ncbi:DUF1127 domain-containing protein [Nitrincola iocasae]|uniref:DUF1127 domain-containing protein n=1 Tax=Nitrincola iocasae TaxID=2614693 RepID=A0A5J6LDP2_9GAMM|nr:DUF1127 domain-containing protein [Nitrincola iocasae]QEW06476.1 DUF1127 domain-containing protein [Nitrincola iocasae]
MSHFSVTRLRHRLHDYWQCYRGRRQLRKLDDRLLKDVGITRSQAHHEGQKHFWNLPPFKRGPYENR